MNIYNDYVIRLITGLGLNVYFPPGNCGFVLTEACSRESRQDNQEQGCFGTRRGQKKAREDEV